MYDYFHFNGVILSLCRLFLQIAKLRKIGRIFVHFYKLSTVVFYSLTLTIFSRQLSIGQLQESDIEHREKRQINRHDPYADSVLKQAENHGRCRTAHIGRRHLKTDDRRAVLPSEIHGCHVLNGRIDGPHSDSNDQNADLPRFQRGRERMQTAKIPVCRKAVQR